MKGLIIWAHSKCRSTMALYRAVKERAQFPVRIVVARFDESSTLAMRHNTGFRADEFDDVEMTSISGDYERGLEILSEYRGYAHLFCAYQTVPAYRKLIVDAGNRGDLVFAAGEAPCNMSSGWRWLAKDIYLRFVLRWKVRKVVKTAKAFFCYSGDASRLSSFAGWPREKIVPFGYFPPPIEGSKCVQRMVGKPFVILSTGILSKYRGADILVRALKILKDRGVTYHAIITQEGELLPQLKKMAKRYDLPVEFPGFLSMQELIKLYESCSVYVGAGRSEPWGMRINDALNCGAPLVVSRGVGAVKLIDDYGCGLVCRANDAKDLAYQLEILATDERKYAEIAKNAVHAAVLISPDRQAQMMISAIQWKSDSAGD